MQTKAFIIAVLLLCAGFKSKAQANDEDNFIISAGPSISWAKGKLSNTTAIGVGGHFEGEFAIKEKFRITTGLSGVTYRGRKIKSSEFEDWYEDFAPLSFTAGAKYFYYDGLFVQAKAGYFANMAAGHGSGFTWSPVAGFEFGEGPYYDISLRYDTYKLHGQNLGGITFTINYEF